MRALVFLSLLLVSVSGYSQDVFNSPIFVEDVEVGVYSYVIENSQLETYSLDGEVIGLQIKSIALGSVFEELNLNIGDVITGIGGLRMDSMLDIVNGLDALSEKSIIELYTPDVRIQHLNRGELPDGSTEIIIQDYEDAARQRDQEVQGRKGGEMQGRMICIDSSIRVPSENRLPYNFRNTPSCKFFGPGFKGLSGLVDLFN